MKPRMTPRWIVFGLAAFVMNFPILATLVTAFKSPGEVSRNPSLWIEAPTLENFAAVLTVSDHITTGEALPADQRERSFGAMLEIALEAAFA